MQPVDNAAEAIANNLASAAPPLASALEDPTALLVATAIIIVSGLVGGYAAALTQNRDSPASEGRSNKLGYYVMLGLVASACVPLFLSLTRSRIMESILRANSSDRFESYLVFSGLCLIAGYTAQSFITSISRRVLQQVEEAREEAKEAKETALEVAEERAALPLSEAQLTELGAEATGHNVDLTDQERAVLRALTKMSFRTATGAAAEAGISRMAVGEVLDQLAAKGLVEMTHSPNTKRIRWAITPQGIATLKAS